VSALFEKYSPSPTFRISLGGGLNFSQTESDHSYSIVHSPGESGLDTYNSKTGFQLGVAAEYRVFHDLWVTAGFQYRRSAYEHILDSVEGTTVNYSEELSYFDVPLAARYYFLKKSFSPWIEGGASLSFLSGAISTTTRSDSKDIVDRSSLRNDFMTGWLVGAGFSYQVKGISLQLSVRYAGYPELVNKEGTRYDDPVNVYKYYYLDDDFRMNLIQVNAGIAYTLTYKYKK
jgi:opacity protein-like surface antigen